MFAICRTVGQVIIEGGGEKEKEEASVKARKERNPDEEKIAERRVKAKKDILSSNISNIILKHQDSIKLTSFKRAIILYKYF